MGVSRSIMPVAWGVWADRSGQRMRLIRLSTVVSLLLFLAIPLVGNFAAVAALMLAYSVFWHALLPQFEVVSLNHVAASGADYSRIRMWGSVGFVFAVLSLGPRAATSVATAMSSWRFLRRSTVRSRSAWGMSPFSAAAANPRAWSFSASSAVIALVRAKMIMASKLSASRMRVNASILWVPATYQ